MNRVLDNIAALVAARHKQIESGDECDLIIGIGFVVTKENYKEVVQCAELAKTLGVDNMRISAVFQPDDDEYFSEIHEEAFRLCRQAESLSDSKFVVFNKILLKSEIGSKKIIYKIILYGKEKKFMGNPNRQTK